MTDFEKALENIADNIKEYRGMKNLDGNRLNLILKELTGTLHYLEQFRSDVHNTFQISVKEFQGKGMSNAAAMNESHIKHPEMYQLRHIMNSAYEVVNAIRTNISWLKIEMQSI